MGVTLAVLGVLTAVASATVRAAPADVAGAQVLCRFDDERLDEISGLAASPTHPGVVWALSDSGSAPVLLALDTASCATLAVLTLDGVEAVDWEALAAGRDGEGRGVLWVGDIGDNDGVRDDVVLHRVLEPRRLVDATVVPDSWPLTYPDGPGDAEALLADPAPGPGRLWVVTKGLFGQVLALPSPLPTPGTRVRPVVVGGAGPVVTDGAYAPDGSTFVLRDYAGVTRYAAPPPGRRLDRLEVPAQRQGEAVTYTRDGTAMLLASEGDPRLLRVPLPLVPTSPPSSPAPAPAPAPASTSGAPSESSSGPLTSAPTATPATDPTDADVGGGRGWLVALGVLAVLALVAAAVAALRRRR